MPAKKLLFAALAFTALIIGTTAFKKSSNKAPAIKQTAAFRDLNKNGKMDVYEDAK